MFPSRSNLKNSFMIIMIFAVVIMTFLVLWTSSAPVPGASEEHMFICKTNFHDTRTRLDNDPDQPIIYFVTPTYTRREQAAELTRLGQTLMHVPHLHWIIADDNLACSPILEKLISRFGIPYTHIASPMPEHYRSAQVVPRGVANRRAALSWIRSNAKAGVLYFGDDDNTFDLKLFDEIRSTQKVSMFPVGLIGDYAISAPIVKNNKIIGFFDSWPAGRIWPIDMAGFAVNLKYLNRSPNATMPYKAGYEEDKFLSSLGLKLDEVEPKANNCKEVLVWHTQTNKQPAPVLHISDKLLHTLGSLESLLKYLKDLGTAHTSALTGVKAWITKDGKAKPL